MLFAVAASPIKAAAFVAGRPGLTWNEAYAIYGLDLNTGKVTGRIWGVTGTGNTLALMYA